MAVNAEQVDHTIKMRTKRAIGNVSLGMPTPSHYSEFDALIHRNVGYLSRFS
jgi:hypothetical protein